MSGERAAILTVVAAVVGVFAGSVAAYLGGANPYIGGMMGGGVAILVLTWKVARRDA